MVGAMPALAQDKPTAMELALLPKFCWGQYNSGFAGPEFTIHGCGPGMNHYCPGLLALKRSEKPSLPKPKQLDQLKKAKRGTEYTLNWMKDYPGCPIRPHVEQTLITVNTRLRLMK